MTRIPTITALVERARKRLAVQLVYEQVAWGAVAGLCGLLLLLLTGTQVLRWYWPLILVVTAAIGWWRVRHKIPSAYKTAQRVDAASAAGDSIATAWYFDNGNTPYTPRADYLEPLQEQAEQTAASISLSEALPWRRPAAAWPLLALLLIAGVTFGIRYGVTNSLDMSAPMAEVSFDTLTGAPVIASEKRPGVKKPALPTPEGMTLPDEDGSQVQESPFAREEQLKSFEVAANQVSQSGKGEKGQMSEDGESGDEGNTGDDESSDDSGQQSTPSGNKEGGKKSPKDATKQPENDGGLMDKLRDALANMMDKFKMDPMEGDQQQMASNKRDGKKGGQGKKQQGERGKNQKDSQPGDSDEAQGDQQGDGQQGEMAKAENNQANESAGKSDKSGVGTQDGKKETELAEHAEAMGKLSELLGKRSKELQGEVMVEVTNSKNQQARTAFTGKKSTHSDTGGELNRDEVPLHLQHYVQQYYEQVRKQTPQPPPPPAPTVPQSGARQ